MLKKALLLIIFALLAILPARFPMVKANPGTIYVPDDFPTIQEAVYNASLGDTIIVRAGIYYENLIVNQTVVLRGEDKTNTIIDGRGIDHVITLKNNSITITKFTIRNSKNYSGIEIDQFGNQTIYDNTFLNNAYGISLLFTDGNTVFDNSFIDNGIASINIGASSANNVTRNYVSQSTYGIKLEGSDNNFIVGNTVSDASYGIYMYSSNWNEVDENNVQSEVVGIYSVYSSDNNIRNNIVSESAYGIELYGGTYNNVFNNTVIQNAYGITLVYSNTNDIYGNLVSNNNWAIQFYDSDNNLVTNNTASYNAYGIYLVATSTGSSIYKNNFLGNTMQVFQHGNSPNTWYTTISGNKYGNYWSDYSGEDTDGDGVGDSPGSIPHWSVDNYPLMNPPTTVHDVAITRVEVSSNTVYNGEIVDITVIARNEGTVNETFSITVKYSGRTLETRPIANLTRYETLTLVFNWNTTDVPPGFEYEIRAEADIVAGETDKADNIYFDGTVLVTIAGDLDGDFDVDADDFFLFSGAYGSSPPSNPGADLDNDGDVDADDFFIFSGNYGKTI